jgi:hypothetical protein
MARGDAGGERRSGESAGAGPEGKSIFGATIVLVASRSSLVGGEDKLIPQLIEKHATSQSNSLQDLQSELRSLKTLLQSRQSSTNPTSNNTASGNNGSSNNGISSTQEAANKLLLPKGKGIPAWQMATAGGASGNVGGSGTSTPSGSGSMVGSGILEKEGQAVGETQDGPST